MSFSAKEIGQRISEKRESLKMSQGELASAAGLSRGKLSMVEIGSRSLTSPELARVADALKVNTDWLLGIREYDTPQATYQDVMDITGLSQDALNYLLLIKNDPVRLASLNSFLSAPQIIDFFEKYTTARLKIFGLQREYSSLSPITDREAIKKIDDSIDYEIYKVQKYLVPFLEHALLSGSFPDLRQ